MQDQAARVVEVVVVRDRLADVAVLLGRARGVELLQLEPQSTTDWSRLSVPTVFAITVS